MEVQDGLNAPVLRHEGLPMVLVQGAVGAGLDSAVVEERAARLTQLSGPTAVRAMTFTF